MSDKPTDVDISIPSLLKLLDQLKTTLINSKPISASAFEKHLEHNKFEHLYNSGAIEGNTLTREEILTAIKGYTVNHKRVNDYLEMDGLRKAYDLMKTLAKKDTPVTEKEIKSIHSLVLSYDESERGKYRKTDIEISGTTYLPPLYDEVPGLMRNLLAAYDSSELHSIQKIAIFHAEFESIHPFIEGNGRTGRLVMNLQLLRNKFPEINIQFSNVMDYYNALKLYQLKDDSEVITTTVIKYVLQELNAQLNLMENKTRSKQDQRKDNRKSTKKPQDR